MYQGRRGNALPYELRLGPSCLRLRRRDDRVGGLLPGETQVCGGGGGDLLQTAAELLLRLGEGGARALRQQQRAGLFLGDALDFDFHLHVRVHVAAQLAALAA